MIYSNTNQSVFEVKIGEALGLLRIFNGCQLKLRRTIDMTIDEAIAKYNKLANNDRTCHPEEAQQLAEWLEELKAIKSDGFTDDLLNMGFTKGYNKALDDFVKFASDMRTVKEEDGTIRPMWLEEMARQLKEQKLKGVET